MALDQHIENSINEMRSIFKDVSNRIEEMKSGDRVPATQLAREIGMKYNIAGPVLYMVLKYSKFLDNYPGIVCKRGARGGIIKL